MANSASDISKHVEELSKLTPVDNESLKKVFPEHLMGNQLMEYSVGKAGMVNIAMGEAKYQLEKETKKIEVKITDGAGVGSSLIAAVFFALNTGLEKETQDSFERVTEIKGYKALVKQENKKNTQESEIRFLYLDRYLVEIEGNYTVDELSNAIDELKLNALPK
ncbi:MAG: hypothetical protein JSS94_10550 [Bacteroidetes bacterium]|nr:hypothetical protein [Bacteroidota bacterium]